MIGPKGGILLVTYFLAILGIGFWTILTILGHFGHSVLAIMSCNGPLVGPLDGLQIHHYVCAHVYNWETFLGHKGRDFSCMTFFT